MMPFKDHYKTLAVPPNASLQEIKKAYRALAHQYHPDKNTHNQYTEGFFREIQEAYHVLSNAHRRVAYDEERWLAGYSMTKQPASVTPEWIYQQCLSLSKHMTTVDIYRMSHAALRDYILLILSNDDMAILERANHQELNRNIVGELLKSMKSLRYDYIPEIIARLNTLAASDIILLAEIKKLTAEQQKQAEWEKIKPYVLILVVVILCVLMLIYGKLMR
ncbi:J domain-containing protein [Taibaiella soli]|uniref:J domain-containing protein n=1 Tax=Taibaiella soli TaxID=1649169 RepID=A0A2W2AIA6_9BACT|nr:J domain-containing protein [Taibaiella soli]PZF73312.1 hypothetical protein DN068_09085 [Taibaiella soli]